MQTVEVVEKFNEADKFIIAAMHQMITLMFNFTGRKLRSDPDFPRIRKQFDQTFDTMKANAYWQVLNAREEESDSSPEEESRPATRQQTAKAV